MENMDAKVIEKIDAVLKLLKKQAPLTVKQEKYCNDSCVERFLKVKGDSVKKAAKHLRAVLSWRENIGIDHLIADEFSSELAEGLAYVAGYDDDARPVVVFRIKQEYLKSHTQKSYLRLLVFTLEVAISTMSRFVDQFVLLYDASFFRSAPAFLNIYMVTVKVIADYYPGRLHRSFVVDPPSIFSCLWKGSRPFVDQWTSTTIISSSSSVSFPRDTADAGPAILSSVTPSRGATSLRFDSTPSSIISSKSKNLSTSSRGFAFTVTSHFDSLKPWYLSSVVPTSPAASLASNPARSLSFASPRAAPRGSQQQPRTPMPSFLQSPFSSSSSSSKKERKEEFGMYVRLYTRGYDEMVYRAKMRPPLGGLLSIVSPQVMMIRQRRQRMGV